MKQGAEMRKWKLGKVMKHHANRAAELKRLIRNADKEYYQRGKPTLTDEEYDSLMRELRDLESKHPQLRSSNSPTRRVGSDLTGDRPSAPHRSPMLSLRNVCSVEELRTWLQSLRHSSKDPDILITPKVDGAAVSILYEGGALVRALTRGDGETGEDVTANVRAMRSVPLEIDYMEPYEVRGEVYWPLSVFEKFKDKYSNPRNGAVGALKQRSPKEVKARGIQFIVHSFPVGDVRTTDALRKAELLGFHCVPRFLASAEELRLTQQGGLGDYLANFKGRTFRCDFLMDGVVLTVDDSPSKKRLGSASNAPKWAVALKLQGNTARTVLRGVTWQVGTQGTVTPVAELKPVELDGTTISRATLHNPAQIARLGLRIGDTVEIRKAGEIIPQVVRVLSSNGGDELNTPLNCPACDSPLRDNHDEGETVSCQNKNCAPQAVRRIQHWAAKDSMDIEGLGPAMIEDWFQRGLITDIPSLYRLPEMAKQGRFYPTKNECKVLHQIEESKTNPLSRVLGGLAIPAVGHTLSRKLAEEFGTVPVILRASGNALVEVLGPDATIQFQTWLRANPSIFDELKDAGLTMKEDITKRGSAFKGEKVVFTGELRSYERTEAQLLVRQHGGETATSISKQTTLVVAGPGAGQKLGKARSLGIRVIDEDEFLKRVGG